MADRSMKIYINYPQTICIYPVKWRLKIRSCLGEVWRQRTTSHNSPQPPPPREVPMADRFMKNYINRPQTTCTHPVKWRLEIPSRFGGVRGQRSSRQTCNGQTCSKIVLHTSEVYNFIFIFNFYDKS